MTPRTTTHSSPVASATDLPVDARLCVALHAAARAMDAAYRPLLEGLGVTYPQYLVLSLLWEQDHQRTGDLSRQIALDPSTMSPLLRRLEEHGLVVRRRGPTDERVVLVDLTRAGRELQARARDVPGAVCEATGLPDQEQSDLVLRLKELTARLRPA